MKKQRYKQDGHLEKRVGIRLSQEQALWLSRIARANGLTVSNIVRELVENRIEQWRGKP
jgi:predicted DNA-binding protein